MKNLEKVKLAIIGGTGFEELLRNPRPLQIKTPYGLVKSLCVGKVAEQEIVFLPRHGLRHSVPPHMINYRANIYALYKIGVERIVATNAVGAIDKNIRPGDVVIPHDFIDFTKHRCGTFYDKAPVTHVDVSQPYCPEIRRLLVDTAKKNELNAWEHGVLACTEGPRYETPAEIEMFRHDGCDIVGMTAFPEVVLARELELCYASICYVSNRAAGMQERLTVSELSEISKQALPKIKKVLTETVRCLPIKRHGLCVCATALRNARFK